ncbi:MAG: PEGA domain-containing protein [Terracidiphilus sp.]|jgi:hypothetical protein
MRKMVGLPLLTLAVRQMSARENWALTVKVLSTKNIENEHGTFRMSSGGGSGGAGWSHRIAEHAFVEASDGNSYELVPDNPKDMLLPGTCHAKIEKRDIRVCEPKDNGNCREVKFKIVGAVPTVNAPDPKTAAAETPAKSSEPTSDQGTPLANSAQPVLSVESTPPGADIEVDGSFVGSTPSTITIVPGSHRITVKKKGFNNWTKTLKVTGGSIHLNASLDPASPTQ